MKNAIIINGDRYDLVPVSGCSGCSGCAFFSPIERACTRHMVCLAFEGAFKDSRHLFVRHNDKQECMAQMSDREIYHNLLDAILDSGEGGRSSVVFANLFEPGVAGKFPSKLTTWRLRATPGKIVETRDLKENEV